MNPAFQGDLKLRTWTPDELRRGGFSAQRYDLLETFTYVSPVYGTTSVPAGFCTDFASVPRFAWSYVDPEDPCILMPSVIHDFLYSKQGMRPDAAPLAREQVDAQFALEAMKLCGARWDQQRIVYAAVRMGGASHWKP